MKMPFGKHKGQLLSELPIKYLMWCHENIIDNDRLSQAIEKELEKRYDEGDLDLWFDDTQDDYGLTRTDVLWGD